MHCSSIFARSMQFYEEYRLTCSVYFDTQPKTTVIDHKQTQITIHNCPGARPRRERERDTKGAYARKSSAFGLTRISTRQLPCSPGNLEKCGVDGRAAQGRRSLGDTRLLVAFLDRPRQIEREHGIRWLKRWKTNAYQGKGSVLFGTSPVAANRLLARQHGVTISDGQATQKSK